MIMQREGRLARFAGERMRENGLPTANETRVKLWFRQSPKKPPRPLSLPRSIRLSSRDLIPERGNLGLFNARSTLQNA